MKTKRNLLHADRHIATLELAVLCAKLGARFRTIRWMTGLSESELNTLFRHPLAGPRRGRYPYSCEWYHTANLPERAEASAVVSLYRRLVDKGISPPLALIGAYRHYLGACHAAHTVIRIGFDRAFDLVAHTAGTWFARTPGFSVFTCPGCQSEYLTSVSLAPSTNYECPYCKLLPRYATDSRLQAAYPTRTIPRQVWPLWVSACKRGEPPA
jgi:hypothetical protein